MSLSKELIIIIIIACLFGCSLTPEYQQPDVPMPESWRVPTETSQSLADLAWWDLFDDEVLDELIRTALEGNKDLRLAVARIDEARGSYTATRADQFPQVDATGSAVREQDSKDLSPGAQPGDEYVLAGVLGWQLDLWGELRAASEAAQAQLYAAESVRRGVIVSLVSNVGRAYFELRDLDNQLQISESTLMTRQRGLEIARLRFKGGLTSRVEVEQSEVEVATAESIIPALKQKIFLKENELNILLGKNPGTIPRGLTLDQQPLLPEVPAGLPSDLLVRRPDIQGAEQALIAANAQVGIAKAQFLPRFSLTAMYGRESDELSDLWNGNAKIWDLGVDAITPVFDAGRNRGNLAAARSRFDQAVISYEQIVQQALREVNDALATYSLAGEQRLAQERLIGASERYFQLAVARYRNGTIAYLDVLDANRRLFEAQLSRSETVKNQLNSLVVLYEALGGGWQEEEIQ